MESHPHYKNYYYKSKIMITSQIFTTSQRERKREKWSIGCVYVLFLKVIFLFYKKKKEENMFRNQKT